MRINCPFCGTRGNEEFTVLGAADPVRPDADAPVPDWVAYAHARENPRGPHRDLWQHQHGCRAWLVVERDTLTHAVIAVRPARDA
ncbi:sarcosine oxidase subunit delta [Falsiroseomonas bella]|uniref:Sarcosine oxidase subunit delta n=1 Tax=Falsiroseomonas bella TaxID=2184016 RepID=A0A317FDB5_9PROT|nr:sarcosine oxidase subunit delta [Falsiroseomonas bella]PWS37081.1 sarcosine oxidase subunit delta [Falsiroseomonas bella]